eukprot:403355148
MESSGFGKLGFYNLAFVSIFCALGGLFSTSITTKIGVNVSLSLGAIFDGAWILFSLLPTMRQNIIKEHGTVDDQSIVYSEDFIQAIMLIASCVCGFTTGLLWTSQGIYISQCATEDSKGFYFGYFWTMYTMSQVVGNLVAALVLGNTDQVTYFIVMSVIAFASSALFITLRKPRQETVSTTQSSLSLDYKNSEIIGINKSRMADLQGSQTTFPEESNQEIMNQQHLQPLLVNNSTQYTLSPSQKNDISQSEVQSPLINQRDTVNKNHESIVENVKQIIVFMVSKRMRFFILEIGWTGFSISYFSGMLVLIMTSSMNGQEIDGQKQYEYAMLAMVALGIGEIIGSQSMGFLVDKFGSKKSVLFNISLIVLMVIFTFVYLINFTFNWPLALIMCFLWGLQDGAINTHCMEMLGFEFENNSAEAFAVFAMFQGIICFVVQLVQCEVVDRQGFLIYTAAIAIIGVVSTGLTWFFEFKKDIKDDEGDRKAIDNIKQRQTFNTCQNLASQVQSDLGFENLGNYSLGLLYLCLGLMSFLSSAVINKIGYKLGMILGGLSHAVWVLSFILPALKQKYKDEGFQEQDSVIFSDAFIQAAVLISSVVNGIGAAVLWTALGTYISECATIQKKGFYFSFFWTCYMSSQVIGNLIGAFVIGKDLTSFFIVMSVVAVVASLSFAFLRKPIDVKQQQDQFKETSHDNFEQDLLLNRKSEVLQLAPPNNRKLQLALLAMVAFGLGEMSGGLFIGYFIDKYSTKKSVIINIINLSLITLFTLIQLLRNRYDTLTFIMTFLWGFQDSAINTHTMQMLGFEFDNNVEPYSKLKLKVGSRC